MQSLLLVPIPKTKNLAQIEAPKLLAMSKTRSSNREMATEESCLCLQNWSDKEKMALVVTIQKGVPTS
jgi:hypothetical protein